MKTNRYDFNAKGKRYILCLVLLTVILQVLYVLLKFVFPVGEFPDQGCNEIIKIDERGFVSKLNEEDLDWYFGGTFTKQTVLTLYENEATLKKLRANVLDDLELLGQSLGGNLVDKATQIETCLQFGGYACVIEKLDTLFESSLSPSTKASIPKGLRIRILGESQQLLLLKENQNNLVEAISAPKSMSIFWISPVGIIVEIFFWSLFGVLVNLMLNSAKFLVKNSFRPREFWIGLTKIVYTPIISFILVFAFMSGYIDFGDYTVRSYSIPIIAFLFGYSVRKTVNLLDSLSKKILGQAEQSIADGPQSIEQRSVARLQAYARPETLQELKVSASRMARELVEDIVRDKESKL